MATKEKKRTNKLHKLSELKKYKISKNDPDVRGWSVVGNDGERMGSVHDLIVDPEFEKVRYLDVEVDRNWVNDRSDYHILVPIGTAKLVRENDVITTPMINKEGIRHYPRYNGNPVSRDFEYELRDYLDTDHEMKRKQDLQHHEHRGDHEHHGDHEHYGEHEHHDHSSHHKSISEMRQNMDEAERERAKYREDVNSGSELERAIAEKNIALLERDIARAERDILKLQLEKLRSGDNSDFYQHDHFNEDHFYEKRR